MGNRRLLHSDAIAASRLILGDRLGRFTTALVSASWPPWRLPGYEHSRPPRRPKGELRSTTRQSPMSAMEYGDYARDRTGWFFGMSGPALALVLLAALPGLAAINGGRWLVLAVWLPVWALLVAMVVVPVRGRPATGWVIALALYGLGGVMGWTRWQSRAAAGICGDLGEADLPGVLAGIQIHDGPPTGVANRRVAVVQNHSAGRGGAGVAAVRRIARHTRLCDWLVCRLGPAGGRGPEGVAGATPPRGAGGPA